MLAGCTGSDETSSDDAATSTSTSRAVREAPATTASSPATFSSTTTSTYPEVPRPEGTGGLVWDACYTTRDIDRVLIEMQMSTQLYNANDEHLLIRRMMTAAADIAATAAAQDPSRQPFADAIARWRDATPQSGPTPDDLMEALRVVGDTCGEYGMDRGSPGEIPPRPDTAEYGRVAACRDIFYDTPDWELYADGQPFTIDDCMDGSEEALAADGREAAYEQTVSTFFDLTPGYACYGETCWTASDFGAY